VTSRPARKPARRALRLLLTLPVLALGLGLIASGPADATGSGREAATARGQATGCPMVGNKFADAGPFAVTVTPEAQHTYYSPTELGSRGCTRHPVILWGNGTWTTPDVYDQLLRHLASHGFIVAAANTSNAGSGIEMRAGLDNLTRFNGQSGHRFYQKVDLTRVGTTGHSQGGGGALETAKDARVKVAAPMAPFLGSQTGLQSDDVLLFFAGTNDTWIPPAGVRARYQGISNPAAYAEYREANHFLFAASAGPFRAPLTAWMRWHLMGDTTARGMFVGANCTLCNDQAWTAYEANQALQRLGTAGPDPTTPTTTPPTSTPPTTGPSGGECVTATNSDHTEAGRATSFLIFSFARGSGQYLGLTWASTSLRLAAQGRWERVQACAPPS
jgi:hypothetical protein